MGSELVIRTLPLFEAEIDAETGLAMPCSSMPPLATMTAEVGRQIRLRKGTAESFDRLASAGSPFAFRWVIVHPATKTQDDGEVISFNRVLWVNEKEQVVEGGGVTALRSLAEIVQLMGLKWPLEKEITVVPHSSRAKNGHMFNWLEPVEA